MTFVLYILSEDDDEEPNEDDAVETGMWKFSFKNFYNDYDESMMNCNNLNTKIKSEYRTPHEFMDWNE